jgi:hypothetical protein
MTTFRGQFVRLWQDLPVARQRLVLVHGSVVNGAVTWAAQEPLAERFALVVSGAHSVPYDIVCDVLAARLGAERAVLPGAGHSVQRLGEPFNALLTSFVERADHANR